MSGGKARDDGGDQRQSRRDVVGRVNGPADPLPANGLQQGLTPSFRRDPAAQLAVIAGHLGLDLRPEDIDEAALGAHVALADLPPPDLFIRTGGDTRVSNFLLWQLAYTELWFTDVLWPEFDAAILQQALDAYASRERRFGLTSAQIAALATETSTP